MTRQVTQKLSIPVFNRLDWSEYIITIIVLAASTALSYKFYKTSKKIGSYYAGRLTPIYVISMSLIASSTSGVSLLGKPAEAYQHGFEFVLMFIFITMMSGVLVHWIYMPILLKLQSDVIYDYFILRFGRGVGKIVVVTHIVTKIFHSTIVLMPPAMVIHEFSGVSRVTVAMILSIITTISTMIGGLQGVVWTDSLQGLVMMASMAALCIISIAKVGGLREILNISSESGRFDFSTPSINPTARMTMLGYLSFLSAIAQMALNQSCFQRFKSLPSLSKARVALWSNLVGILVFAIASSFVGLAINAYYYGCDPKSAEITKDYSSVIIYWLNDVGSKIYSLRGIYIGGIVSASISTISTDINTAAGLVCSEIAQLLPETKNVSLFHQRLITLFVGTLSTVLVLLVNNSGTLLELSLSFTSLDSIVSALFTMGALIVPVNRRGAQAGGTVGFAFVFVTWIGRKVYDESGVVFPQSRKMMRTDLCPFNVSSTPWTELPGNENYENTMFIFRISQFNVGVVGFFITIVVGIVVSLLFPGIDNEHQCDPDLYMPCVHRFLRGRETPEKYKMVMNEQDSSQNV